MSYERAWVVGVFGTALVKRDGGAPDRPAADRIRVGRVGGYKTITLRMHAVLNAVRAIHQPANFDSWSNARKKIPANPSLP
jgi:hypothetical protein